MDSNGHSFLDTVFTIIKEERSLNEPLIRFEHPRRLQAILDLGLSKPTSDKQLESCVRQILQYSVKTHQATFRNQLYGGTDIYGLAGAWVSEAFNTSQYTFEVAPAFTLIELEVLRHILALFGMHQGDGIFSPGGSMSMLYAVVAARFKAFPEVKRRGMRGLPEMVLFTSEDSHYSIMKAAHWLGFGTESVRVVKTDDHGQMLVADLEEAIKETLTAGRHPLLVNATAGTTVLGAIDDLDTVADVCQRHQIWMHVDACWGGSLMLSQKHRTKLKGVERANSIAWNPHKMAGAPLQCSVFLVKEKGLLHEANSASAQYLFQQDKFYDVRYDTGDKSVQCGRKIDAFKLWLMWKARGDCGLNALTDRVMTTAEYCLNAVGRRHGFRLLSSRLQCPNVCFWYLPKFLRGQEEDPHWWDLVHKITPKIKELLTLNSHLMVAYSPLRHHKNFFRLAFTFHPFVEETHVIQMLDAIEECGETVTPSASTLQLAVYSGVHWETDKWLFLLSYCDSSQLADGAAVAIIFNNIPALLKILGTGRCNTNLPTTLTGKTVENLAKGYKLHYLLNSPMVTTSYSTPTSSPRVSRQSRQTECAPSPRHSAPSSPHHRNLSPSVALFFHQTSGQSSLTPPHSSNMLSPSLLRQ